MNSWQWAALAAAITTASVASLRPTRMFSITVLLNSTTFWNTTEKSFIRTVESMGAMSVPPSVILPLSTV